MQYKYFIKYKLKSTDIKHIRHPEHVHETIVALVMEFHNVRKFLNMKQTVQAQIRLLLVI